MKRTTKRIPKPTPRLAAIVAVALTHAASFVAPHIAKAQATHTALPAQDFIAANAGVIRITPILHATFQMEYQGKVIIVDPVGAGSYAKKADIVLITDIHGDHLDKAGIARVRKPQTFVIAPPAVVAQLKNTCIVSQPRRLLSLHNGASFRTTTNAGPGRLQTISIEAVPMYNLKRGPKPGQKYHSKGRGNGYIVTLGGKRLYIAGDTEATPEMRRLRDIAAAFLPMNLPFTMTPQEAAAGARAFRPRTVYPYHYRYPFNKANTNPQQFASALRNTRIRVRLLNWYPAGAVARAVAAMR